MTTAVNIVIPNWNGLRFLPKCLASIQEQQFADWQITVVDNGSSDGSLAYLQAQSQLSVIALPKNQGFSAAVNAGILSSAAPYVFLLNNDTELSPDCLQQLLKAAEELPDSAFFAPKMLSFHDRTVLDGAGDGYLRGGAGYRLGTLEKDCEVYNHPQPVFGACAGAALYRRRLFERVGLFDEDFFAYLEDVDFNLRLNRAGFKGHYVPAAKVYHIGSATSGSKFNPFTIRLSTRNSVYVLLKHYSLSLCLRFLPVIVIYQLCWLLFTIKKGQFKAYCQGMTQAMANSSKMWRKGKEIRQHDSLTEPEFAAHLQAAEQAAVASILRRCREQKKNTWLLRAYQALFL
ncbi:glycosyltransferase family 2 protein [Candidatus Electronema sp. PJ]|uniref:glycosyltransferase family 2 protein n=1 Tax=Candidatus Electronema sp. PJ TaxID=3401572 RepID=UPI003AA9842E